MSSPQTLVLVPTALELQRLEGFGELPLDRVSLEVCGFGVIAAAARTSQLLAERRPDRVLLLGIAGAFDATLTPLGSALEFSSVVVDGIGAGEGESRIGPRAMGFPQWAGAPDSGAPGIFDRLELSAPPSTDAVLLTGCAASGDAAQASHRRHRFPEARAEDMEGFAVAMACSLHGCPLRIVRGISNLAGDRDAGRWRIADALLAAQALASRILACQVWEVRVR